jgi:BirA family biotin operon repressor/biotin-[acetyl-CoA-carboxylase] ligase
VLQEEPSTCHLAKLASLLAERLAGTIDNVVCLDAVDSTHAAGLRIIDHVESEGLRLRATVIIAGRQTGGMGRGGRQWASPTGGLYLSWIESGLSSKSIGLLPMLAAAAAHFAVGSLGLEEIDIKWPNDLLVGGRKLAGILVHARHGESSSVTVGLGVNLGSAPDLAEAPPHPPTALCEHLRPAHVRQWAGEIAVRFVSSLVESLENPEPALSSWRRHLVHAVGDSLAVRLSSGTVESGIFAGLTEEGFLRLQQGTSERIVTGGDVVEG